MNDKTAQEDSAATMNDDEAPGLQQQQDDEPVDDFGDFAGAKPEREETNHDDLLGTEPHVEQNDTDGDKPKEDDFGAFADGGATQDAGDVPVEGNEAIVSGSEQESSPDDDFGYFSAISVDNGEGNAENADEAMSNKDEDGNNDAVSEGEVENAFGDFTAVDDTAALEERCNEAAATLDTEAEEQGASPDDIGKSGDEPLAEFGDFSEGAGGADQPVADTIEHDETYGGSNSDQVPREGQVDQEHLEMNDEVQDKEHADASSSEKVSAEKDDEAEDEFGEFGTFDEAAPSGSPSAEDVKTAVDDDTPASTNDGGPDEKDVEVEDDFGTLNEATSSGSPDATDMKTSGVDDDMPEPAAEYLPADEKDDEAKDDFGTFSETATSGSPDATDMKTSAVDDDTPVPASESQPADEEDDETNDDFGTFSEAATGGSPDAVEVKTNSVTHETTMPATEGAPAEKDDEPEDDFGTFEAAPDDSPRAADAVIDQDTPKADEVDDDFGDFASFEQAQGPTAAQVDQTVAEEAEDDEFGDFGDFTDGGTSNEAATVSEAVDDAGTKSDSSLPTSSTSVVDEVTRKAESVFHAIFHQTVEESSSEGDQEASSRTIISTHEVLSSLAESSQDEGATSWCKEALSSVLCGVDYSGKPGPVAVVNEGSELPYSHFAVPIGGLPMSEVDTRAASPRRRDVLRKVELATSKDSGPAKASEPTVNEKVSSKPIEAASAPGESPATGTVVQLPPLKPNETAASTQNGSDNSDPNFADFVAVDVPAGSNGKKEALSANAKQFLQQIPDLSFMLKPTLSLPKKR